MAEREAWIIDGVRTPRGKGRPTGALHGVHPQELLGQCLNALVERTGVTPTFVEDVIVGNGNTVGDHLGIGRLAPLAAGWPVEIPGFNLNRFCGSGQQAVTLAAMGVMSGLQDVVVAGGVESMSRWPVDPAAAPPTIDGQNPAFRARHPVVPQGIAADLIATLEGFSRQQCDALAVTSQERAAKALAEGRFERSTVAVRAADGTVVLDREEFPRPGTTLEGLAALPPSFAAMGSTRFEPFDRSFDELCLQTYPEIDAVDHVHHAGNSSGVVDGAAAILVTSSRFAQAHGLAPRARLCMAATAGADPVIMLTAPGPAARLCLEKAHMAIGDIDVWEINEAFAAVVLKAMRDLELDPELVNPNGGAIALGHPIGATGAMLVLTALDELERTDAETALIAMCTGGGMGTATIIERVERP
ncbi:MAG: acetyl-CoA C-acetyltransferase [Actinomycetota bacterium]|jgi:acetyl-CoA C-acetyltransferase